MAKLTQNQLQVKLERELKRQKALEAKKAIKEKKVEEDINIYRNKYRALFGDEYTPKLMDLVDIDDFFPKIERQLGEDGRPLKNDINKFIDYEEKRKEEEKSLNKEIEDNAFSSQFNGRAKKTEDKPKKLTQSENERMIEFFTKFKTRIGDFTPQYNKYICSCCGSIKLIEEFPFSGSIANGGRVDKNKEVHGTICRACVTRIFDGYYLNECNKDVKLAMERTCCDLNLYWDEKVFELARIAFEKNNRRLHITSEYYGELGREKINYYTYWDSPVVRGGTKNIKESKSNMSLESKKKDLEIIENTIDYSSIEGDILHRWDKEDSDNKRTVIKMVGYDPFEYEEEEDRKILYKDLLNLIDLGMENDLFKMQSAIQIVQSFFKIRNMNRIIADMEKKIRDPDNKEKISYKDIKEITDLKAKEMTAVTNFAKDNGFSERYAAAKAKGEGSLSGIMNKMINTNYESAIVNRYDIETSESIQQAANASFKAIFSQLSLGEADVWKIVQNQLEDLKNLRNMSDKLKEENRLLKCEIKKEELIQVAKENGIEIEDEGY